MKPFIIFIFCATVVVAQTQEYVLGEAVTCIPHEYLSLPEGKTKAAIDEITMTQSLIEVFQKYGVTEIEKVFHNFQRKDTLVYNDDGRLVKIPDLSRDYKLIFSCERSVDSLIEELNQLDEVVYAQPNHIYQLEAIPDDLYFWRQWGLNQAEDHDINAPEAWDFQTGNTGVKIGIFDSGIEYLHTDLANVQGGKNYFNFR